MAEIGTAIAVTIPTPSVTAGPLWAQEVSDFLTEVNDGFAAGVRSSIGLTIDADLPMGGFVLSGCGGIGLSAVAAPTGTTQRIYVQTGGELHYRDLAGNDVQITAGGALNAASLGGINGDYGVGNPADVSYVDATSTFVFTQDPGVSAKLDVGDIRVRETIASANAVTIRSPASLSSAYNFTLPIKPTFGAGYNLLTIDSTGALAFTTNPDVLEIIADDATIVNVNASGSIVNAGATTCTGTVTVTAGDIICSGAGKVVHGTRIQTDESDIRHDARTTYLGYGAGKWIFANDKSLITGVVADADFDFSGKFKRVHASSGGTANENGIFSGIFHLPIPTGCTLTTVTANIKSTVSLPPRMLVSSVDLFTGATVQLGTTQTAAADTAVHTLTVSGLTASTAVLLYSIEVQLREALQECYSVSWTHTRP